MQSSIGWSLLGLIIERPSYAYELAQRFERTYGDALTLSSASHAYSTLSTLEERGLIEEIPGTRAGRQPRPHYRATPKGLEEYQQWLIGQVAQERKRHKVFLLQLVALTRDPRKAMAVLDDYEQACLDESCATALSTRGEDESAQSSGIVSLQAQLIAEEKRLAIGAKIAWARYARSKIKAYIESRDEGR